MSEERVHELLYSCDSRTELCEMIAGLEDENAKLQASNEVIAEDHAALCEHNIKLQEYVQTLEAANLDVTSRLQDYIGQYDPTDAFVIEAKAKNESLQNDADLLREMLQAKSQEVHTLMSENAKLRELASDLYEMAWPEYPSAFEKAFVNRMHRLGVKV